MLWRRATAQPRTALSPCHPIMMFRLLGFQLSPHLLEEPVITKDIYEVAVSLILMFDDLDVKESG